MIEFKIVETGMDKKSGEIYIGLLEHGKDKQTEEEFMKLWYSVQSKRMYYLVPVDELDQIPFGD